MLAASFMLPKYLCPSLSWHAHICTYTPMSAKSERDMYKSSVEKMYIQIEVNDMRRSRALDNHLVPSRTS